MQRRRRKDSGFALLLIFLMAAMIAITLYMEIPRVAFDTQRQKEMLLIERGEQYKRAIQLFVRKNSRYPAKIEELESLNSRRYLRQRYKDPITGKDEWRMIHAGPGGVLTDSIVNKPKTDKQASTQNFITEQAPIGGSTAQGQQGVNLGLRRRASEGGTPGGTVLGPDGMPVPQPVTDPNATAAQQMGQSGTTGQPGQIPGLPGQTAQAGQIPGFPGQTVQPGQTGQPGQIPGFPGQMAQPGQTGQPGQIPGFPGQVFPGQQAPGTGTAATGLAGMPGAARAPGQSASGTSQPYIGGNQPYIGGNQPYIGGSQSYVGGQVPGAPGQIRAGMPGAPVNSQTGGVSPQPYSTVPGAQGASPAYPQPGMTTGNNPATDLIRQLLTTPRPGGIPPSNTGTVGAPNLGPGIAGIASTSEAEGILVYNERSQYNEWEFIYDPAKEKRIANPAAGTVGTPADRMGSQTGTGSQGSTFGGSQGSTFGGSQGSTFGGSQGSTFGGSQGSTFGGTQPGAQQQPAGGIGRRP